MPLNDTLTIRPNVVTEVTTANVTAITLVNSGEHTLKLIAGTALPSYKDGAGWMPLKPGVGVSDDLANIFRGLANATRVYVYGEFGGEVFVSHA